MNIESQLKPGSYEAVKMGCICPISDNARGKGIKRCGEVLYWINKSCSLHGIISSKHN